MNWPEKWLLASAALLAAAAAVASETITYTYDARGRVTKVVRSGTVNAGVNTSYSYDKADNRINKTTTGAGGAGLGAGAAPPPTMPEEPMSEDPATVAGEPAAPDEPRSDAPESPERLQ